MVACGRTSFKQRLRFDAFRCGHGFDRCVYHMTSRVPMKGEFKFRVSAQEDLPDPFSKFERLCISGKAEYTVICGAMTYFRPEKAHVHCQSSPICQRSPTWPSRSE